MSQFYFTGVEAFISLYRLRVRVKGCIVSSTYKRESTLKPMKANTWNVCIHYLSRDNPIELENMDQRILSQWYHS